MPKPTKKKITVKAWGIVNLVPGFPSEEPTLWGVGGIAGDTPIQVFSSLSRAEFTVKLGQHTEEVMKGTTAIIPVTIIYHV